MNYYPRIGLLLFTCFLSINMLGQEKVVTLNDARRYAIQTNKNLKIASAEELAALYDKKEAYTKYFPDVSFAGSYERNQENLHLIRNSSIPNSISIPGNGDFPISDGLKKTITNLGEVDIKNVWVGKFSLVQPVFMGGEIVAYNDIKKNALELTRSSKNTKLQDIIVELDVVYWQVVSLSDKKKLAKSYLDLLNVMYSDITAMEEEGTATKADVLSVAVKKNEADLALTKVENNLSLSRMQLNQLCNFPIDENVTLFDEINNIDFEDVSEQALPNIDEAFSNRSELKSLEFVQKIYKGQEKIAKATFMPKLAISANYLWNNRDYFYNGTLGGAWNFGVVLSVPLNIASSTYKYKTAKAQTLVQAYRIEEAKDKIELQVNQSAYRVNEAYKKYRTSVKNMESSNENLRYANLGFEEGVIPASDALNAHTAWLAAHSDLIDAKIDIKLSHVYFDKALGRNLDITEYK